MIIDITLKVDKQLAVWPGDTPFAFQWKWKMAKGDPVNVGSVEMSIHTGTHVDAPYHFLEKGERIDEVEPEVYVGPALVVDVRGDEVIGLGSLKDADLSETPRVLFRTGAWEDHSQFPESFPVMEEALIDYLAEQGVRLVGLDVPSVDPPESKNLANHHRLAANGIYILESLDLRKADPGLYELIALPLKIGGADGSPVRAVLRSVD